MPRYNSVFENKNRLTLEKMLSNDRRGVNFLFWVQKAQTKVGFEPRPESDSFTSTEALTTRLSEPCHRISKNRFCLNNKLYFGVRALKSLKNQEVREKVT